MGLGSRTNDMTVWPILCRKVTARIRKGRGLIKKVDTGQVGSPERYSVVLSSAAAQVTGGCAKLLG